MGDRNANSNLTKTTLLLVSTLTVMSGATISPLLARYAIALFRGCKR